MIGQIDQTIMVSSYTLDENPGVGTVGLEDLQLPVISSTNKKSAILGLDEKESILQIGGNSVPYGVGIGCLISDIENLWYLFNSGKYIVYTQEITIRGAACYNAATNCTNVNVSVIYGQSAGVGNYMSDPVLLYNGQPI